VTNIFGAFSNENKYYKCLADEEDMVGEAVGTDLVMVMEGMDLVMVMEGMVMV
jgi:hypothetical protein